MPNAAFFASASGGGRVPVSKPPVTHTAAQQYTIGSYDPGAVYTVTKTAGSGSVSRSGATITTVRPVEFTVTWMFGKATTPSPPTSVYNYAITYYTQVNYTGTAWYPHGMPCHSANCSFCPQNGCIGACSWYPPNGTCGHSDGYNTCSYPMNPAPPGQPYANEFSEWSYVN